ncbi:hypothetical protein [Mycolicibacterium brumae]|uniref:Uncharacterized protein n=1 Tax=Mycolicibacterium brumae TaxID=85968 RepID=A0A2G5PA12_9MYCO|nr:hypothetical protein [Mycolicibacterium brumae]MCV7193711.1 hypothetical protein [Mycolicibacterium brumae]PIB75097.1 hypothetical protein CQY22_010880 [Mycolicibacterium brumae]RWA17411.1 hypothetical protein MBRU_07215 [Mycolicibacterium brumae DSM 44177]UWW09018.1 hypothetical protein L2Z93_002099 [Mycolicibacterium brumae]
MLVGDSQDTFDLAAGATDGQIGFRLEPYGVLLAIALEAVSMYPVSRSVAAAVLASADLADCAADLFQLPVDNGVAATSLLRALGGLGGCVASVAEAAGQAGAGAVGAVLSLVTSLPVLLANSVWGAFAEALNRYSKITMTLSSGAGVGAARPLASLSSCYCTEMGEFGNSSLGVEESENVFRLERTKDLGHWSVDSGQLLKADLRWLSVDGAEILDDRRTDNTHHCLVFLELITPDGEKLIDTEFPCGSVESEQRAWSTEQPGVFIARATAELSERDGDERRVLDRVVAETPIIVKPAA